jgi:hypothetical protein
VSGADNLSANRFTFSGRLIPQAVPRAQIRTTLTYRITPRLQAGIEVNPRSTEEKANPLANWLALPERRTMPAVIVGTSSDRIGTPGGQSFYATASKSLKPELNLPIAPYIGVAYGTYEDRLRPIGGLNISFTEQLGALVIFDGVHVHPTLNFNYQRHVFSFVLARGKEPGVSYSISF